MSTELEDTSCETSNTPKEGLLSKNINSCADMPNAMEELKDCKEGNDKNRKTLKINILQLRADTLQKEIDKEMLSVEKKCEEYADIMNELNALNGLNKEQQARHNELLDKMIGCESNQTVEQPSMGIFDKCKTSEDMIKVIEKELATSNISGMYDEKNTPTPAPGLVDGHMVEQKDIIDAADQLANLDGNAEIWDRIAKAHTELEKEKSTPKTDSVEDLQSSLSDEPSEDDIDLTSSTII